MKSIKLLIPISFIALLLSCSNDKKADGYGNFEATEITISSEANGKLQFLNIEEGQLVEKGAVLGLVDTLQPYLNKQQLLATKATVASKSGGVWSQVEMLQEELKNIKIEQQRVQNMFADNAATQQQLDQANSRVDVLKKQIKNVESKNSPIINEGKAIAAQVALVEEQITRSNIINPINGTVLAKYAEPGELVSFGKPLYKVANLNLMELRVYLSQTQLSNIKIGQQVTVKVDSGDTMKEYTGKISWISSSAEFTPKIIQTKEERVNLVYAIKIIIENDGSLKIGMPAEMWIHGQ
ncbi:HlyD family secretion protein [Arenibacter certesii]|uniref:Membrane protein n=1 Tax=Arenibacter certesii TaxID=228955 RepID=A0A918J077_9FLAO|nr:HlyD family efflux transporter periplasmic adaptor subunit [Arenibacter certesii]GGW41270.1 membrane protein [Arenibacter certesii]